MVGGRASGSYDSEFIDGAAMRGREQDSGGVSDMVDATSNGPLGFSIRPLPIARVYGTDSRIITLLDAAHQQAATESLRQTLLSTIEARSNEARAMVPVSRNDQRPAAASKVLERIGERVRETRVPLSPEDLQVYATMVNVVSAQLRAPGEPLTFAALVQSTWRTFLETGDLQHFWDACVTAWNGDQEAKIRFLVLVGDQYPILRATIVGLSSLVYKSATSGIFGSYIAVPLLVLSISTALMSIIPGVKYITTTFAMIMSLTAGTVGYAATRVTCDASTTLQGRLGCVALDPGLNLLDKLAEAFQLIKVAIRSSDFNTKLAVVDSSLWEILITLTPAYAAGIVRWVTMTEDLGEPLPIGARPTAASSSSSSSSFAPAHKQSIVGWIYDRLAGQVMESTFAKQEGSTGTAMEGVMEGAIGGSRNNGTIIPSTPGQANRGAATVAIEGEEEEEEEEFRPLSRWLFGSINAQATAGADLTKTLASQTTECQASAPNEGDLPEAEGEEEEDEEEEFRRPLSRWLFGSINARMTAGADLAKTLDSQEMECRAGAPKQADLSMATRDQLDVIASYLNERDPSGDAHGETMAQRIAIPVSIVAPSNQNATLLGQLDDENEAPIQTTSAIQPTAADLYDSGTLVSDYTRGIAGHVNSLWGRLGELVSAGSHQLGGSIAAAAVVPGPLTVAELYSQIATGVGEEASLIAGLLEQNIVGTAAYGTYSIILTQLGIDRWLESKSDLTRIRIAKSITSALLRNPFTAQAVRYGAHVASRGHLIATFITYFLSLIESAPRTMARPDIKAPVQLGHATDWPPGTWQLFVTALLTFPQLYHSMTTKGWNLQGFALGIRNTLGWLVRATTQSVLSILFVRLGIPVRLAHLFSSVGIAITLQIWQRLVGAPWQRRVPIDTAHLAEFLPLRLEQLETRSYPRQITDLVRASEGYDAAVRVTNVDRGHFARQLVNLFDEPFDDFPVDDPSEPRRVFGLPPAADGRPITQALSPDSVVYAVRSNRTSRTLTARQMIAYPLQLGSVSKCGAVFTRNAYLTVGNLEQLMGGPSGHILEDLNGPPVQRWSVECNPNTGAIDRAGAFDAYVSGIVRIFFIIRALRAAASRSAGVRSRLPRLYMAYVPSDAQISSAFASETEEALRRTLDASPTALLNRNRAETLTMGRQIEETLRQQVGGARGAPTRLRTSIISTMGTLLSKRSEQTCLQTTTVTARPKDAAARLRVREARAAATRGELGLQSEEVLGRRLGALHLRPPARGETETAELARWLREPNNLVHMQAVYDAPARDTELELANFGLMDGRSILSTDEVITSEFPTRRRELEWVIGGLDTDTTAQTSAMVARMLDGKSKASTDVITALGNLKTEVQHQMRRPLDLTSTPTDAIRAEWTRMATLRVALQTTVEQWIHRFGTQDVPTRKGLAQYQLALCQAARLQALLPTLDILDPTFKTREERESEEGESEEGERDERERGEGQRSIVATQNPNIPLSDDAIDMQLGADSGGRYGTRASQAAEFFADACRAIQELHELGFTFSDPNQRLLASGRELGRGHGQLEIEEEPEATMSRLRIADFCYAPAGDTTGTGDLLTLYTLTSIEPTAQSIRDIVGAEPTMRTDSTANVMMRGLTALSALFGLRDPSTAALTATYAIASDLFLLGGLLYELLVDSRYAQWSMNPRRRDILRAAVRRAYRNQMLMGALGPLDELTLDLLYVLIVQEPSLYYPFETRSIQQLTDRHPYFEWAPRLQDPTKRLVQTLVPPQSANESYRVAYTIATRRTTVLPTPLFMIVESRKATESAAWQEVLTASLQKVVQGAPRNVHAAIRASWRIAMRNPLRPDALSFAVAPSAKNAAVRNRKQQMLSTVTSDNQQTPPPVEGRKRTRNQQAPPPNAALPTSPQVVSPPARGRPRPPAPRDRLAKAPTSTVSLAETPVVAVSSPPAVPRPKRKRERERELLPTALFESNQSPPLLSPVRAKRPRLAEASAAPPMVPVPALSLGPNGVPTTTAATATRSTMRRRN